MRIPWKRRPPSAIEEILRENRPEPRAEFTQVLLTRLALPRARGVHGSPVGMRAAAAAIAISALALVGAAIAAGGPGAATRSLGGFVDVSHLTQTSHQDKDGWGDPRWPGSWETSIPVCHKTGSTWVILHLSASETSADLLHNPHDYIASPNHPFPPH